MSFPLRSYCDSIMFHCALIEFEPLDISITSNGVSHIAQLPIGYDDSTNLRYSLFVVMDMVPGYEADTKELVFCILEADLVSEHVERIWDGRALRGVVGDSGHRQAILSALLQMVGALIDDVAPRVVTMHTREADLPPKALMKYHLIATMFQNAGYVAGRSDIWHGRHTWMMERRI